MKTLTLILLSGFYALSSAGFTVNLHYCLGELEEIELFGHGKDCCCGMDDVMSGCCDDDTYALSSEEDQLPSNIIFDFVQGLFVAHEFIEHHEIVFTEITNVSFFADLPPPNNLPIWLVNCNLTYYG